jgi:hypothetical protein
MSDFCSKHGPSAACDGEVCRCGKPATHKIGEEIPHDLNQARHNLTAYVCCACFTWLFGPTTGYSEPG